MTAELPNLETLNAHTVAGSLPTEVGAWTQMLGLIVGGAQLTGTLPTELGNLQRLTVLDVGFNSLQGTLPTEIGRLNGLNKLDVGIQKSATGLTGALPTEIALLAHLTNLEVQGNSLHGRIPTEFAEFKGVIDSCELSVRPPYHMRNKFYGLMDANNQPTIESLSACFIREDPDFSASPTDARPSAAEDVSQILDDLKFELVTLCLVGLACFCLGAYRRFLPSD